MIDENMTLQEQTVPITYYGIPPIRHSHYEWKTAAAFFCNGVGGGSQILACGADLLGGGEARPLVQRGRHLALAGGSVSTALLISALHTPLRWYNMLRIFRKTSPMSIGIWAITPFTALSALAEASLLAERSGYPRAGRLLGRIFGIPAALLGGVVVSYMGTELEETSTPLWAIGHPLMSPLYAAAGMSNAAAAVAAAGRSERLSPAIRKKMGMLSLAFETVETLLNGVLQSRWRSLPETASLRRSRYAALSRFGLAGTGAAGPLLMRLFMSSTNGHSRGYSVPASVAKLTGAVLMQLVMIYTGRESGKRAGDYFEYTSPSKMNGDSPAPVSGKRIDHIENQSRHGRSWTIPAGIGVAAAGIAAAFLFKNRSRKRRG